MARKKKGLPFVVQPRLEPIVERLGTEETGIIEILRKGYLTVAEKSITQGALNGDVSVRNMYALAGRIGRETGKPQAVVAKDLIEQDREEYLDPYAEEISDCIMEMVAFQQRVSIIQATALIMCRIDTDWTVEETMEMNPELVADLALFYSEEDSNTTDALEAAANEESGAVEGK